MLLRINLKETTHPLAFVRPQIVSTLVASGRQIDLIERQAGPVQINLAAGAPQAGTQLVIDLDRVDPRIGIMPAHEAPTHVIMERAADKGGLRRLGIFVPPQPCQTIALRHPLLDQ